jgi:hypothetical protein
VGPLCDELGPRRLVSFGRGVDHDLLSKHDEAHMTF